MIVRTAGQLRVLVRRVLIAAGADEANAADVAEHLVLANLSGVDTHGIYHVPGYVQAIRAGELLPAEHPRVVRESEVSTVVAGNWTFGQVTAKEAMRRAIAKAERSGVAVSGLMETHHIGRLGHYVEMAAQADLIAIVMAGGFSEEDPHAAPYGGRSRALHTNPIAMGFPAGDEAPMMFDFATTALSGVKVATARRRGERLPAGAAVDVHGNPTTDPNDFFAGGAALPFGGHKGYALMMAAEFLGQAFSGADSFAQDGRGGAILGHHGAAMIVMRADLLRPLEDYRARADLLQRRIRAVPPAPGFEEVLVPGDPEQRTREIRERDGIPIYDDVWRDLVETAESLGVAAS